MSFKIETSGAPVLTWAPPEQIREGIAMTPSARVDALLSRTGGHPSAGDLRQMVEEAERAAGETTERFIVGYLLDKCAGKWSIEDVAAEIEAVAGRALARERNP